MMGLAVASMAHRVKNILMGLEGGVYIINDGFESGERAAVAQGWSMVQRNVERIAAVVKDLLFCSKDRVPEFAEGVRPAEILDEVYELYRKRTEAEQIDLVLEADRELVGTLAPEGVHSLAANLVANAIDACRFDSGDKPHWIAIRCRRGPADSIVIEVADNGGGIPADVHDKVFKGFFSTKGTEGTGLGLLVVQKIVVEHGGTISFASVESEGTTFTAVLPARPPGGSSAGEPSPDPAGEPPAERPAGGVGEAAASLPEAAPRAAGDPNETIHPPAR
jgi:signal transduction histidine kinase